MAKPNRNSAKLTPRMDQVVRASRVLGEPLESTRSGSESGPPRPVVGASTRRGRGVGHRHVGLSVNAEVGRAEPRVCPAPEVCLHTHRQQRRCPPSPLAYRPAQGSYLPCVSAACGCAGPGRGAPPSPRTYVVSRSTPRGCASLGQLVPPRVSASSAVRPGKVASSGATSAGHTHWDGQAKCRRRLRAGRRVAPPGGAQPLPAIRLGENSRCLR